MNAASSGGCKCASGSSNSTNVRSSTVSTRRVIVNSTILCPALSRLNRAVAPLLEPTRSRPSASAAISAALKSGSVSRVCKARRQRSSRAPLVQTFMLAPNSLARVPILLGIPTPSRCLLARFSPIYEYLIPFLRCPRSGNARKVSNALNVIETRFAKRSPGSVGFKIELPHSFNVCTFLS